MIVTGLVLHAALYAGLMLTGVFWVIIAAFVVAGLGEGLVNPALSAAYLDITPEEHRSRAMGIKTAIGSLGSLLAPALVALLIQHIPPEGVFSVSAVLIVVAALVVLVALRLPTPAAAARDPAWEASQERVMAARSVLHDLTVSAATARKLRTPA